MQSRAAVRRRKDGIRLIQRQPEDLARSIAAVAMRRLGKRVRQLPFLLLVAPLRGGLRDDVVGTATRADRRRSRGPRRSPFAVRLLLRSLLALVKRIEE